VKICIWLFFIPYVFNVTQFLDTWHQLIMSYFVLFLAPDEN
jgi:hypothetical protein